MMTPTGKTRSGSRLTGTTPTVAPGKRKLPGRLETSIHGIKGTFNHSNMTKAQMYEMLRQAVENTK